MKLLWEFLLINKFPWWKENIKIIKKEHHLNLNFPQQPQIFKEVNFLRKETLYLHDETNFLGIST